MAHVYVSSEQLQMWRINSLWPSDAICRCRSGSTLAQIMACCLTAPSYYLNQRWLIHYSDVIMSAMVSQITSVLIVCSTVCPGADQRKHQSSASLAFVGGEPPVPGGFPSHMTNNAENVSIWWRHHDWLRSNDIHLRTISREIRHPSITKISLKITYLKFHSNLTGANELNWKLEYCISGECWSAGVWGGAWSVPVGRGRWRQTLATLKVLVFSTSSTRESSFHLQGCWSDIVFH